MKKMFFLLLATIAATTALVSCDTDTFLEADAHAACFMISDPTHINVYDQFLILVEENKDAEFSIQPQARLIRLTSEPLAPAEGETMEHRIIINDGIARESYIETFKYNHFENMLRVEGLFIQTTDALGEKFNLACLSALKMTAAINVVEHQDQPFYEKYEITYTLLASDTLEIAKTVQEVILTNDLELATKLFF